MRAVTFYSYKGGSGRSTTAINTVNRLIKEIGATPESPILLVDSDVESAGLTYFFKMENKFSDVFTQSLHTTRFFSDRDSVRDETIFRKSTGAFSMPQPVSNETIKSIARIEYGTIDESNVSTVKAWFDGVLLTKKERDCLDFIVSKTLEGAERTKDSTRGPRDAVTKAILGQYDLLTLTGRLANAKDKTPEEKTAITRDYLPATTFVDISSYFEGCKPNTVRFLGADVGYRGERLAAAGEEEESRNISGYVKRLIDTCDRFGYSAVIFDSSAGVQRTADALNCTSDVLVYCMRPTTQFIKGTRTQLLDYKEKLEQRRNARDHKADGKIVILLPTAVPMGFDKGSSKNASLKKASFEAIEGMAKEFSGILDPTFCTYETALNEVSLFKWKEQILTADCSEEDEIKAYAVYGELAKKLLEVSKNKAE